MEEHPTEPYGIPVRGSLSAPFSQLMGTQTGTFGGLIAKEWLFLVLSLVNLVATLALTIYRLVVVIEDDPKQPDFTFCILIIVNAAFCFFYLIHGLWREMQYELYALVAAISVILVYCVVEYLVNNDGRTTVKLVRLIAACVLAPVNIILAVVVAREFGYLEFRIIGASQALQSMYREATRFCCLLTFDLQVAVSFVILALYQGTSIAWQEIITLSIGIPFCLAWYILGWYMTKREWRWAAWLCAVLGLAVPAYVTYKIVELILMLTDTHDLFASNEMVLIYLTLAAGFFSLLVRLVVLIDLYRIYHNFGEGLRERAFSTDPDERSSLLSAPTTGRRKWHRT